MTSRSSAQRGRAPSPRPTLRLITGGAGRPERPPAELAARSRRDAARLVALVLALNAFGLIIVLSASAVAFAVFARIDLAVLRRVAVPLLAVTVLLLLVVLAPGIGSTVGGSSRWIGAGPLKIQPSELAKLAFVLFAADLVVRREHVEDQVRELVRPVVVVVGVMALLILKQPDMGTATVMLCIASAILYAGGVRGRLLGGVMGMLFLAGAVMALVAPYRRARLLSFVNPFAHASTSGYQVVQSLVALGSGHLTGTGLGTSPAKWGYLPNAWTDFIFAVIGNEMGLIGGVLVLGAFVAFGWLGMRIAANSRDRFAGLVAVGITAWIVCQAFINIGGVIGILPETGIPLPFLSSGGSSLVVALGAVGLLVNIGGQGVPARPRRAAPSAVRAPRAGPARPARVATARVK